MTSESAKSGLKAYKPGDVLFNEADAADSLFIIQKGQVRLYRPKGKGFIELAVLRSGEVIGEMAYFDEEGAPRRRSCSASALTPVEVVEISFTAFGKTMQSLNPWFKTIINTLVSRLKRTNSRVKELEDNQAVNYGSKSGTYEFLKPIEVTRILGTLFLVFKAHGEVKFQALSVHRKTLTLYSADMYQIMEVKLESLLSSLVTLGWMEIREDDDRLPNLLLMKNVEIIRQIFLFYNTERQLTEEKKLRISDKCEAFIAVMIEKASTNPVLDIPNIKFDEDAPPKFTKMVKLAPILDEFKARHEKVNVDVLEDGKNVGFFGEVLSVGGVLHVEADFPKVQKMWPIIRFMNSVHRLNREKAPST